MSGARVSDAVVSAVKLCQALAVLHVCAWRSAYMRPQSCKAKGRRLQCFVVDELMEAFPELREGDLRSTSSGANGEDVQMSPRAQELIPYSFEAKNQERLNIWAAIEQANTNANRRVPVVVIKKNHSAPHVVLPWKAFLRLIRAPSPPSDDDAVQKDPLDARWAAGDGTAHRAPACEDSSELLKLGEQIVQLAHRMKSRELNNLGSAMSVDE